MKILRVIIVSFLVLVLLYILFFQPSLLVLSLGNNAGITLGSLVSWLFLILFPLFFLVTLSFWEGNTKDKLFKKVLQINLIMGLCWGIISYLLSGSWNYVFDGKTAFMIWIVFTAIIVVLPLLIFILKMFSKILSRS